MNIKEKLTHYWYISLPVILLSVLVVYLLGYFAGQWYYDIMH